MPCYFALNEYIEKEPEMWIAQVYREYKGHFCSLLESIIIILCGSLHFSTIEKSFVVLSIPLGSG